MAVTSLTWTSSSGGNFGSKPNWSPSATPTSAGGFDVLFDSRYDGNGTYTATVNGIFAANITTLQSSGATIAWNSGRSFTTNVFTLNSGTIALSQGTLAVNDSLFVNGGRFNETGGTLTVTNLAEFDGGTNTLSAGIFNAGTVVIGNGTTGGTFLTLNGGTLNPGVAGGTITINAGATLAAGSGANDIKSSLAGTGAVAIGAGSTLTLDGLSIASGISFTLGGAGSILDFGSVAALSGFSATVYGLIDGGSLTAPKNAIEVSGATGFTASYNSGVITLHGGSVEGKTIHLGTNLYDPLHTAAEVITSGSNSEIFLYNSAVCFAEGTRVLTDRGEIAVETLAEGDIVITADHEALPVRWVGYRHIDLANHPRAEFAAPVRIRRGAFAENQPQRDLVVSPDHCIFVNGKLIPAKLLINGMTVVQERDTKAITYYHVELDRHAVLLAEGLPAESYLDTGNRAFFNNAGLALMLHPEFHVNAGLNCWEQDACAPLAVSETAVQPVWQLLANRAMELGFTQPEVLTTNEADLRLVADGRTFRPTSAHANRFVFVLPGGITGVQLMSRADSPASARPWLDDRRQLGVAVSRVVVRNDVDYTDVPVDHPSLRHGWHAVETENLAMWRWTDGNALLPIQAGEGPITVEVHVRQLGTYVVAKAEMVPRLAA